MEIITGRITADAQVRTLKDKRQVVSFSIAINRSFTSQGEKKQEATYFNCSYWMSTKIAGMLTKGSIVQLCGHTGLNAYKDMAGDYHSHLTFHVNNLNLLSGGGKAKTVVEQAPEPAKDDLPF